MLHITNAYKKFAETMVLEQVNLTVAPHSIVGLAGSSGSGKSTLLRCIQQLETLDEGSIYFAGKSGFMFQDFQLFPHMTVLNNLIYAPKHHDKKSNPTPQALALLDTLGLKEKAQSYPHQLSGGQKQRVALARSLIMKPDLLLCDEPTSGLDTQAIEGVVSLLQTIKSLSVTLIIASHDLAFLTRIADRIVVLKAGHLTADITPATMPHAIHFLKQHYRGHAV